MFLFFQFCLGQVKGRNPLHGQVVNDSVSLNGGYVFNLTAKMKTFIADEGYFDILAKKNDTLLISSLAFQSRKLVLTAEDLAKSLLIVKLETFTNQLKEVVVPKTRIPYLGSKQEIIDKPYFDDAQSTAKNSTTPLYGIENGVNFIKMGRLIGDLFMKRKDLKGKGSYYENFQDAAFKTVNPDFFKKSLGLKENEIGLFLIFCENDGKAKSFLAAEDKFNLIDFMISKKKEYDRITIFTK